MKRNGGSGSRSYFILRPSAFILRFGVSFAFIGRLAGHHNIAPSARNRRPASRAFLFRRGCGAWRGPRIIPAVPRRVHVARLRIGENPLDAAEAHHARDVLRLTDGTPVEAFDDAGAVARGVLVFRGARDAAVRVETIRSPRDTTGAVRLTVAAAVPKGERADWMVEKLSELGVAGFVPLAAARSVVLPEGKNKRQRWLRLATEAAKQSRRAGVMRIGELTSLSDALAAARGTVAWYRATETDAQPAPIGEALADVGDGATITAFVGPEGGWTADELEAFSAAGARAVRLTQTVLRVETAAIAVAAVVGSVET